MNSFLMTIAGLIFIVGLSIGVAYLYLEKRKLEESKNRRIIEPQEDEIDVESARAIILTEVKHVKQLAVLRKTYQSGIDIKDSTKIFGLSLPGTKKRLALDYSINVVCGCDLDKIKIAGNFSNGRHLRINLPGSEIFDIYADINTFVVRDKDSGVFASDVQVEEQNREIAADVQSVKQNLIDSGILEESNKNVLQIIRSITEPLGITAEIEFFDSNLFDTRPDLLRLE